MVIKPRHERRVITTPIQNAPTQSEPMKQPNQSVGQLPIMAAAFLALVLALVGFF